MSGAAKTNEWKLGLFVVGVLAASFASLLWLGRDKLERKIIPAVTYFDESVQGLDAGAPVKFRGVTVGTVAQIGVAPDRRRVAILVNFYGEVLTSLGLRKGSASGELDMTKPFAPPDARFQLASAGITGVRFIALDLFDPVRYPPPELRFPLPWNYIPAAPSTLKSIEDTFTTVAAEAPGMIVELKRLMIDARRFMRDVDARGLSKEAQTLLKHADQAVTAVDARGLSRRARDTMVAIDRTLAAVDRLAGQATSLISDVRGKEGDVRRVIQELTDALGTLRGAIEDARVGDTTASLRETAEAATRLADDARPVAEDLHGTLLELRETTAAVRRLAEALERDPAQALHGRPPSVPPPGGPR